MYERPEPEKTTSVKSFRVPGPPAKEYAIQPALSEVTKIAYWFPVAWRSRPEWIWLAPSEVRRPSVAAHAPPGFHSLRTCFSPLSQSSLEELDGSRLHRGQTSPRLHGRAFLRPTSPTPHFLVRQPNYTQPAQGFPTEPLKRVPLAHSRASPTSCLIAILTNGYRSITGW
jgi:hypothetical protein